MKNTELEILASLTGPQKTLAVLAVNSASLRGSPRPITQAELIYLNPELILSALNDLVNSGVLNRDGFQAADSAVQAIVDDLGYAALSPAEQGNAAGRADNLRTQD